MRFKVDLGQINRDEFSVSERPNGTLIVPTKTKHVWTEDELHMRSLMVDADGHVISSGFPKFRNYGENVVDDRLFEDAVNRQQVTVYDKLDGSLFIVSVNKGEITHMRTRGSHELGEFHEHIMPLVEKYKVHRVTEFAPGMSYSVLFEFVSPEKQIIVRYPQPDLFLLGLVWHDNLILSVDRDHLDYMSDLTNVPVAPQWFLNDAATADKLVNAVRKLEGEEGVVVSFYHNGNLKLIKVKADAYCRLHAIRFRTEGKGAKLAYLLGIESPDEIVPKLASIGIDFEGAEYIRPEIEQYLVYLDNARGNFEEFRDFVYAAMEHYGADRKAFVMAMKEATNRQQFMGWFPEAMLIYDGKEEDALLCFIADVLDEPLQAVKNWSKTDELSKMLKAPVLEDV